jgi:hypothetical protein
MALTGRNWEEVQAMLADPKSYIVIFVSTHGSIPQPPPDDTVPISFTVPKNTFVLSSSRYGMTSNTDHANQFFKLLQPNGIKRSFNFFFGGYGEKGELAHYQQDRNAYGLLQCAFPGEQAVNKVLSYGVKERIQAVNEQQGWGIYILDPNLPQPAYTAKNVAGKNMFFEMTEPLVKKKFMIKDKSVPIVNLFKRYTSAEEVTKIMEENYHDRIKLIFFESCAVVYDHVGDEGYDEKLAHYSAAQDLWNAPTFGGYTFPGGVHDVQSFITARSMNQEPPESEDSIRLTALRNGAAIPERTNIDPSDILRKTTKGPITRGQIAKYAAELEEAAVAAVVGGPEVGAAAGGLGGGGMRRKTKRKLNKLRKRRFTRRHYRNNHLLFKK